MFNAEQIGQGPTEGATVKIRTSLSANEPEKKLQFEK